MPKSICNEILNEIIIKNKLIVNKNKEETKCIVNKNNLGPNPSIKLNNFLLIIIEPHFYL